MTAPTLIAALALTLAALPALADPAAPRGHAPAPAVARVADGLQLIMVERPGCPYCEAWRREILPGYADHPQGRALPVSIIQMDGPWPDGLALARAPFVTPTFILLRDRQEVARIEGYPGQRHFWPMMAELLALDRAAGRR